jgi:hypothetical protein
MDNMRFPLLDLQKDFRGTAAVHFFYEYMPVPAVYNTFFNHGFLFRP